LIVLVDRPIIRAERSSGVRSLSKVVAMSESDDCYENVNRGRVPMDCFDFVTKDGILVHADTFDLEAAKRFQAQSTQTNPRSDQNLQHSG
jgi:hypothetical protein